MDLNLFASTLLDRRTAIVTGGSSGIGAATADALTAVGAQVYIFDRQAPASPFEDAFRLCDVTDEDAVRNAMATVAAERGGIDILVNNAGGGAPGLLDDMSLAEWTNVVSANLTSAFLCTKHFLAHLSGEGGAVVNVASFAAKRMSYTLGANYTAAKAGLLGLTRHSAVELARHGVRVNAVCPGPTLTPAIEAHLDEAQRDAVARTVPHGRWVRPDEIAQAIVYLASPAASMCAGISIDIDGGVAVSNGAPYDDYISRQQGGRA